MKQLTTWHICRRGFSPVRLRAQLRELRERRQQVLDRIRQLENKETPTPCPSTPASY